MDEENQGQQEGKKGHLRMTWIRFIRPSLISAGVILAIYVLMTFCLHRDTVSGIILVIFLATMFLAGRAFSIWWNVGSWKRHIGFWGTVLTPGLGAIIFYLAVCTLAVGSCWSFSERFTLCSRNYTLGVAFMYSFLPFGFTLILFLGMLLVHLGKGGKGKG
jgi:hypothetical protein